MAESGRGKIRLFEDFIGPENLVSLAVGAGHLGDFRVIGQGIEVDDSGVTSGETDPNLNGVGKLIATDEDNHSLGLTTGMMFDVGLMAPIVMEARVQFSDLNTKSFYFGLTDVNGDAAILKGGNLAGDTNTLLTLTASDLCGFFLSSELDEDEMWHMVYNGGDTTGEVLSTNVEASDAVAAQWDVIRIEVDPNGDARWYLNGDLRQTVEGAVSTSTDLAVLCMVHNLQNTGTTEAVDLDYILITANRDWTR